MKKGFVFCLFSEVKVEGIRYIVFYIRNTEDTDGNK